MRKKVIYLFAMIDGVDWCDSSKLIYNRDPKIGPAVMRTSGEVMYHFKGKRLSKAEVDSYLKGFVK